MRVQALLEKLQQMISEMQITDVGRFTKQQIFNEEKATLYWTKMCHPSMMDSLRGRLKSGFKESQDMLLDY